MKHHCKKYCAGFGLVLASFRPLTSPASLVSHYLLILIDTALYDGHCLVDHGIPELYQTLRRILREAFAF